EAESAVRDGEIVCLDENGTGVSQGSKDLTECSAMEKTSDICRDRKQRLRGLVPRTGQRLLYSDHVELRGERLFELVCNRDLEGIVAKRKFDRYLLDGSAIWLKIRNRNYSQWIGREELFERERGSEFDWQ